jgi:hypothetical protein
MSRSNTFQLSIDFKIEELAKEWKNILVVSFFSLQTNECYRKLWNYQYCQVDSFLKKFMDMCRLLLISRRDIRFKVTGYQKPAI